MTENVPTFWDLARERSEIYRNFMDSNLFEREFEKITKGFSPEEINRFLRPGDVLFSITFDLALACCRYRIKHLQGQVNQLTEDVQQIREQPVIVNSNDPNKLTDIEKKVLKGFMEGKTGAAVAKETGLSPPTVSYYRQKFVKMNIL